MADISDVEKALSRALRAEFFPDQSVRSDTLTPSAFMVDGQPVKLRITRGSPIPAKLDEHAGQGGCIITICAEPGVMRPTTRFPRQWKVARKVQTTMGVSVTGTTVSITGEATAGQYVAIGVGGQGYTHVCQDGETAQQVAAGLADQIPGAVADDASVVIATTAKVEALTGADTIMFREVARQVQAFRLDVWAPNDRLRDAVAAKVITVLGRLRTLVLADGSKTTNPRLVGQWPDEFGQKVKIWRRWSRVEIEYATTETLVAPPVLHFGVNTGHGTLGRFRPGAL